MKKLSLPRSEWAGVSVFAAAAAVALLPAAAAAQTSPMSCSASRCSITTGESGVVAYRYFTGLPRIERLSEVDVISLSKRCRVIRLHYRLESQGGSHLLAAVSVPVGRAATTSGGPWRVRTSAWLTMTIRARLRSSGAHRAIPFSLPHPMSPWHVYVGHDKTETLARRGVSCLL